MNDQNETDDLLCARCVKVLKPGAGDFFVVKIEAVADPTPPVFENPNHASRDDIEADFREAIAALENMSEIEAREQVARMLTIHLCQNCYGDWIENPA